MYVSASHENNHWVNISDTNNGLHTFSKHFTATDLTTPYYVTQALFIHWQHLPGPYMNLASLCE
jgi:hypothetical protein